jgi:hypothetical protein
MGIGTVLAVQWMDAYRVAQGGYVCTWYLVKTDLDGNVVEMHVPCSNVVYLMQSIIINNSYNIQQPK